jgi:hypothetical protein
MSLQHNRGFTSGTPTLTRAHDIIKSFIGTARTKYVYLCVPIIILRQASQQSTNTFYIIFGSKLTSGFNGISCFGQFVEFGYLRNDCF